MLSDFNKSIPKGENVNKTFCIVNELKTLESEQNQIIKKMI